MIIQDFFPTLLEMDGITDYKTVQYIDGQNIVPYLKDPLLKDDHRLLVWNFPNNWTGGNVSRDYSLVLRHTSG